MWTVNPMAFDWDLYSPFRKELFAMSPSKSHGSWCSPKMVTIQHSARVGNNSAHDSKSKPPVEWSAYILLPGYSPRKQDWLYCTVDILHWIVCLVTQRLFNRSGWPLQSSWHPLTAHRLQARDVTCSLSATPRVVYDFLFILIAHLLMAMFWSESAVLESQMTGYNYLCLQNWGKPQRHSFARNDDDKPWNFGMLVSHLKQHMGENNQ